MELTNPFEYHTARFSTPESVDIPSPRKKATEKIVKSFKDVQKNRVPKIVPVLGEAGYGKTHLFWQLKEEIGNNALVIYITSPASADRFFAHVYFSILKNYGVGLLQDVSNILVKKFTQEQATTIYPGRGALMLDFFYALQDAEKNKTAKLWLAGNHNSQLGKSRDIIEMNEELAQAALRIIIENSPLPFVLFLDEMETCFFTKGEKEELLLLENIKRLYNETENFMIVLACVTQIWDKITELSSVSVQGRIERPVMLQRFKKEDLEDYIKLKMKKYWESMQLEPGKDDLWPFTNENVEQIYKEAGGNPRETIKTLYNFIEERKEMIMKDLMISNDTRGQTIESIKALIEASPIKVNVGSMNEKIGQFFVLSKGKKRLLMWNPNDEAIQNAEVVERVNKFVQEGYQKIIVLKESNEYIPGSAWLDINNPDAIMTCINEVFAA